VKVEAFQSTKSPICRATVSANKIYKQICEIRGPHGGKISTVVFWVVKMYCGKLFPTIRRCIYTEDGGDTFLQNVVRHAQVYAASQPPFGKPLQ
jgi:hypothetical protein